EVEAELSLDLGMLTDAVWSDVDGDGWEDLLITREWDSPLLLKNEAGKAFHEVADPSMQNKKGLWSAVLAVDLDQDGDDDYILGNLGLNHRFEISEQHPMQLYAVDIDDNNTLDPIITAYWPDSLGQMQEYPVNYLDELMAQSPFFRKYTSYTRFSKAPISYIFKADSIPDHQRYTVNTSMSYVLWNEGGTLEWEALPRGLQMAPIKEMLAYDFTADGQVEVLIGGNDHSYDVATGLFDANKGQLLKADGRVLRILSPQQTGLLLNGQVESLLYFEGERPYLVAGINRRKIAVFEHLKASIK
ncbi:MAG: FG-GAP-like repeat-containing protein, partial [Bacteroidota bacterium]